MPNSEPMLHAIRNLRGTWRNLPSTIPYVTNDAFRRSEMPRLLRLLLSLTLVSVLLASAACEDDPNDLDFTHPDEHGDHEHDEDAG